MKTAKVILAMLFLLGLFIPSGSVHADICPPPAPELGGLEPFEYKNTNVQMVYERVEMEVEPFRDSSEDTDSFMASRVNVTAYFTMHNHGVFSESMQVIFPIESFTHCRIAYGGGTSFTTYFIQEDSFVATINGNRVSTQKVVTNHPFRIEGVCEQMTWAGFDVTFPADEDVVIKVQYSMETMGSPDFMQNIEYILETGAGWAGPIRRGYVIVKFPYTATRENMLPESTPGHQFLYNEIFWSFENLEPTSRNNIHVSIVSPGIWQRILLLRRDLKENPELPEKWLELAQIYSGISMWHAGELRSADYYQKAYTAYEAGIAANPDNAELYAKYAGFKLYNWSPQLNRQITGDKASQILSLLNKALALEPNNETARMILSNLVDVAPFVTFTHPPTIPSTATSLFTATPSITPTATMTPFPSETALVVTVVHTKVVNPPTSTQKPEPMTVSSPTEVVVQDGKQPKTSTLAMVFGALVLFIAGIGAGKFGSKRTGK